VRDFPGCGFAATLFIEIRTGSAPPVSSTCLISEFKEKPIHGTTIDHAFDAAAPVYVLLERAIFMISPRSYFY